MQTQRKTHPRISASPLRTGRASLVLPFAVVGAAGGWLADGLLANPLVNAIPRNNQAVAAAIAGGVGAALGAVLSPQVKAHDALGSHAFTAPWLAALVVLGGAVTGGLVGGLEMGTSWGALSGASNGALSAVAFVPVCVLVLAAARRAERARQGSLVAGADRRAVWSILATALAVTTLAAALDVPASRAHPISVAPHLGLFMGAAAALLVAAALAADAWALYRLRHLARAGLEDRDPSEARDAGAVPSVDLGLGDDVRARVGRASSAYRGRARPLALLLGSVAEARSALARALLRGSVGLAVTGAVLAGHLWAGTPAALLAFEDQRCEHSMSACYDAGLLRLPYAAPEGCPAPLPLTEREQRGVELGYDRGVELLQKACVAGNRCACDAVLQGHAVAFGSDSGVRAKPVMPTWYVPR